jgi:hypothetical protein
MKTLDYEWVNNQKELNEMIELGYTMGLSICNDTRGKYVVCNEDYKEVFEEVTGEQYDERDGTFGMAFPLNDESFVETLFES